jgi:hypothetical protein
MFRNGHAHNLMPHVLEYSDGKISWGISSSSSSVVRPWDPGYQNDDYPEGYREPEKEFEYTIFKSGKGHASLSLERFYAHILYDLKEKQKNETRKKLEVIVGQKFDSKRPGLKTT